MLTYILDSSAYLRLVDREAGDGRVADIIEHHTQQRARVIISAIQWGEIVKIITNRGGNLAVAEIALDLRTLGIAVIAATADRAERAALIGLKHKIAYADAFAVELTLASPDHILVTADYGVKPAEKDVRIEFLPIKPKP